MQLDPQPHPELPPGGPQMELAAGLRAHLEACLPISKSSGVLMDFQSLKAANLIG